MNKPLDPLCSNGKKSILNVVELFNKNNQKLTTTRNSLSAILSIFDGSCDEIPFIPTTTPEPIKMTLLDSFYDISDNQNNLISQIDEMLSMIKNILK